MNTTPSFVAARLRLTQEASHRSSLQPRVTMLAGALALTGLLDAHAALELVRETTPVPVFAGDTRSVPLTWRNAGGEPVDESLRYGLYQASSATAALIAAGAWKQLQLLPGQTVIESALIPFPLVNSQTAFVIRWFAGTNRLVGITTVAAYPPGLLKRLAPIADGKPLGVFDPGNRLRPALASAGVEIEDLENGEHASFTGRLAILGPFDSVSQLPPRFAESVKALARRGGAVVWLQQPEATARLTPSFHTLTEGAGTIVVADPQLIRNLTDDPEAQLRLVALAEEALKPAPRQLPGAATHE